MFTALHPLKFNNYVPLTLKIAYLVIFFGGVELQEDICYFSDETIFHLKPKHLKNEKDLLK